MQPNTKALYRIKEQPTYGRTNQLALHIQIIDDYLCFYDTIRGHMLHGELVDTYENGFVFNVIQPGAATEGKWTFEEVTLTYFKLYMAKKIANGPTIANAMRNTEDLWEWYRKSFPI